MPTHSTHDKSVTKVSSSFSPTGEMGQTYLASGTKLSMRLWKNEPPGKHKAPTTRDYETVGFVISGRAELHLEGQVVLLEPGDSWVVPAGSMHTYRILERFTAVEATAPPAQAHGRDEPRSLAGWRPGEARALLALAPCHDACGRCDGHVRSWLPMDFEIREPVDEDEGLVFFRMASKALLGQLSNAEKWMQREGLGNVRLALIDGQIAGGLSVQRMGQWFGGRSVPCGAVRCVAVAPEFRGERVADRLLAWSLAELRREGVALAMLFPATQHVYRRAGFEQAGVWIEYEATLSDFPSRGGDLPVREVAVDDPRMIHIYSEQARRTSGLLDRSEWLWQRVHDPIVPLDLSAYLLGPAGAPEGYLLTHVRRGEGTHDSELIVRDRALLTPAAVARARAFLAHHRSTLGGGVCLIGGVVEPLLVGLPNQLQDVGRRIDWMLRLVDPAAALAARGYAPGVKAEVHLLVRDPQAPGRDEAMVLRVREGRAEVTPGGLGRLGVDVRGLAAMYSGHMGAAEVAAMGYLDASPEAAALDTVFAGPRPWVMDFV